MTTTDELVRDPLYSQVNDVLRAMLRRGEFAPGDQFLTERQVSERFGISRATANKALAALVGEGTLEFRKGVGTFVRGGLLDYDLRSLVSFTEKARAAGKEPRTRVLRFESRPANADDAPAEWRGVGPLWYMERLRLADETPVILERRYLSATHCPGLVAEDISGSLYELFTARFGLAIAGAEETIRAVALAPGDAALLDAPPGSAALRVVAVGLLPDDSPLWHEETLYRGDAYEFRNRLGPVRAPGNGRQAGPAAGRLISHGGQNAQ
jgi:GntR family transcriptional regulator